MQRNRCKSVWRRKTSQYTRIEKLQQEPSFQKLRTVSKRLAIMSRMEKKKLKSSQQNLINNTCSNLDLSIQQNDYKNSKNIKRPATTGYNQNRKMNNINSVKQAYKQEKKINDNIMAEKYCTTVKTNTTNSVKQGLLGEYQRYSEMSKHQLIQKLISLQYLANNIFRKNKLLQDKLKVLDPNYKAN